jgi:hypothetical protein
MKHHKNKMNQDSNKQMSSSKTNSKSSAKHTGDFRDPRGRLHGADGKFKSE